MYNKIFTALIIFIILITLCIALTKPVMHKNFIIYSHEYQLITEEKKQQKTVEKQKQIEKKAETKLQKVAVTKPVEKKIITSQKENKVKNKTVKTVTEKPTVKKEEKKQEIIKTPQETTEVKKIENKQTIEVKKNEVKHDIDSEYSIEWNKWRSDLQNRIMQDVKLPQIKEGIIFKFSFDVDKYGKITDVQTWSTTSVYTPYAIQYIAPVIKSYQGKDFLNFPEGSNRYITTVTGGWKISQTLKLSSPNDYNDQEKIRK